MRSPLGRCRLEDSEAAASGSGRVCPEIISSSSTVIDTCILCLCAQGISAHRSDDPSCRLTSALTVADLTSD
ncbi:hypothetical protein GBF38_021437, partial [Nibea albiflora]